MDLPVVLDDWSWVEQPISSSINIDAFFLRKPETPDWKELSQFYPYCPGGKTIFWLCPIENTDWTLFEVENGQWILMPLTKSPAHEESLKGPITPISEYENNGEKIWIYLARYPLKPLQTAMMSYYSQKVDSFQSIEKENDVWILKEGMGRVVFSEQGEYVILAHYL
ncbi:hypothetical protein V6D52_01980 [Idiomarina loihiensis]|jgi:hypothetical protein|uniref:hypothetical protein n=1 Tax=Idiomarina TaxID=135575 RepID=UPI000C0FF1D4|nr:hypothetical protein [Idiomarina]MAA62311.1 hypothetical protein [Idiomarina sp.]PHQ89972.1 MAG: hypothetical protein COB44_07130 [Idiomarina sp.]PWW41430.1 hypothetical protein DFO83_101110 [Idiomarina loihiensis]TDP50488.1 hypothetical protein DET58_101110 [Idiomarina loihiensis]TDS25234.1 hypothetical protein DET62_101329 [Idiomarina sp. H2]|tara:strand:- start:1287 stop:1787 length:501 start_codon:yes stop_codon:yes gene_type:complete